MSDDNSKKYDSGSKGTRDAIYVTIIIILLIGGGILFWQMSERGKVLEQCQANNEVLQSDLDGAVEILGVEAEDFKDELKQMVGEYDELIASNVKLGNENTALLDSLRAEKEKVETLLKDAERNKYLRRELYKYKKEAETLRNIMRGYVHTIDSLMIENGELTVSLGETKKELTETSEKLENVEVEKNQLEETVAAGQILKTVNLSPNAIRLKRNGDQRETSRARRTDMIKACFMLLENRIAKAGKKNIYLRVISPAGEVLGSPDNKFKTESTEIRYSSAREVNYQNDDLDVCVYHDLDGKEISDGTYIVEIYADGEKVGAETFDLK